MGTKTTDEAAGTPATENDEAAGTRVALQKETPGTPVTPQDTTGAALDTEEPDDVDETDGTEPPVTENSFVGQGAAAIVAAVLGLVSLTGGWIGTVASARETLIGGMQTSGSTDVAAIVKEGYGDAWNATALYAGAFALLGLLVAVVTLVRPAFGAPGAPQPAWIKSVAWAGAALGVIGLILAVLKYTDLLLGLPATS
ncbi:hypothetical protein ABZX40_27380 [Streptomyces sp. NPDC004610]|uniref:hypothetical protein n=1 Tax=unclassified Streptomyces TaxID=2593676 RepID=UPI0033B3B09F